MKPLLCKGFRRNGSLDRIGIASLPGSYPSWRRGAGVVRTATLGTHGPRFATDEGPSKCEKTLLCKGFSVERVTGIEPAWPAWKASGTRSRLSVKMVADLRISVFDLDRCGP